MKKISHKQIREIKTLKDATIDELSKEINFRRQKNEFIFIRAVEAGGHKTEDCEVHYWFSKYYEPKNIINCSFYFIVNGKEEDFYYGDHGVDRDDWTKLIPDRFAESMENVYEFNINGSKDDTLKEFKKILSKCGYKKIKMIEDPEI